MKSRYVLYVIGISIILSAIFLIVTLIVSPAMHLFPLAAIIFGALLMVVRYVGARAKKHSPIFLVTERGKARKAN